MIDLGSGLAWIRRVLGTRSDGAGIGDRTKSRSRASRRRGTLVCETCGGRVSDGVVRCPLCGNQVACPDAPGVADSARRSLSEIEKRILIAAVKGPDGCYIIHVLPTSDRVEGEIKAGNQRLYGQKAIAAVEALQHSGYVERGQDQTLKLTDQGQKLAAALWS